MVYVCGCGVLKQGEGRKEKGREEKERKKKNCMENLKLLWALEKKKKHFTMMVVVMGFFSTLLSCGF